MPHRNWNAKKWKKPNALIRKTYKISLALEESAGAPCLPEPGLTNTLDDIADVNRASQFERLSLTSTGRDTVLNLGVS
ncbi:hypothetical protein HPB50_004309 [Hyalomma asiaticum]|uniref:Uncharacterized protein n=1 Tax=Hyalomma asiaticum TaxID=266040 RepID=A0ACB7RJ37_HYAAI|nr:hypothetical protein HPB50_004309 [Hyalomma asiaticum]